MIREKGSQWQKHEQSHQSLQLKEQLEDEGPKLISVPLAARPPRFSTPIRQKAISSSKGSAYRAKNSILALLKGLTFFEKSTKSAIIPFLVL